MYPFVYFTDGSKRDETLNFQLCIEEMKTKNVCLSLFHRTPEGVRLEGTAVGHLGPALILPAR